MTLSAKLNHLPPLTPLASADIMRSVQIDASAQPISRCWASVPCVAFAGTPGTAACVIFGLPAANFLPPFPRGGFAARPSRGVCRSGTMKVLTPVALTRTTGLSAYSAPPSGRSDPNHASLPMVAFHSRLSASGCSRLRPYPAGSPRVCAVSGSCSFRPTVRLRLLPTPPRGDAVAFGYKVTTRLGGESHPADKASSRTHWVPGTSPGKGVLEPEFAAKRSYALHLNFPRTTLRLA